MGLMKKLTLLMAAVIVSTLAVPAIGQPERGIDVGQGIEPRELKTIEREKVHLPAPEGLTAVIFWATWSPRSVKALELWQQFGDHYSENGLRVITVNSDHQDMGTEDEVKIRDYIVENGITLPVVVDAQLELFNEIGVIVLPTTLFFKPNGTLDYKYASFPSSAEMDLKEDLEIKLGIAEEIDEEEAANRGKLVYQPKNNALLFYNMGRRIHQKGFPEKAKAKYIEALQKDPEYIDPLLALEKMFLESGMKAETRERLESLLSASGLGGLIEKISLAQAPPTGPEEQVEHADPAPALASTEEKPLSPMEKMRLLMEKNK